MTAFDYAASAVPATQGHLRLHGYVYPPEPLASSSTSVESLTDLSIGTNDMQSRSGNNYEEVYALTGQMPGGYFLREPVSIRVTFEGTEFVAEQPKLEVHAFGDSAIEAVINLRDRIVENYRRLQELDQRLSPRMREQRRLMEGLLLRTDA